MDYLVPANWGCTWEILLLFLSVPPEFYLEPKRSGFSELFLRTGIFKARKTLLHVGSCISHFCSPSRAAFVFTPIKAGLWLWECCIYLVFGLSESISCWLIFIRTKETPWSLSGRCVRAFLGCFSFLAALQTNILYQCPSCIRLGFLFQDSVHCTEVVVRKEPPGNCHFSLCSSLSCYPQL